MDVLDLRSDTVTRPTPAMLEAMARAELGDDGYGDDPTVRRLEELGASLVGKESALLVPSGTFGNQLALFTHCPRGGEVILDDACHIVRHEAGASAVIAGVQLRCVDCARGPLTPRSILERLRDPDDIHSPSTSLVCLENAHSNGRAILLEDMEAAYALCSSRSIPVHLDGARIFNAAIALGLPASKIAACSDSVMFCLSKGLCAPIGSLLAGSASFIMDARRKRKVMGGQLRQAGIIAACGIVGLTEQLPRLGEDHETAKLLADALSGLPGIELDREALDINMVFFRLREHAEGKPANDPIAICAALRDRGILVNPPVSGEWRLVTHRGIGTESLPAIVRAFGEALEAGSR